MVNGPAVHVQDFSVHLKSTSTTAERAILHKISFTAPASSLTALLGPSGAGKSTMLSAMNTSITLPTSGEIYAGSSKISTLRTELGFVKQEDTLPPYLTVREVLVEAALLRNTEISKKRAFEVADELLGVLALEAVAGTVVGSPELARGISGGERKRLNIGSVLASGETKILLCDEPTSGLDSTAALSVVTVLKKLANQGITIVCVLHQPSEEIFSLFDHVVLFGAGRLAYSGPASEAGATVAEVSGLPFTPETELTGDYLLRAASCASASSTHPAPGEEHVVDGVHMLKSCDADSVLGKLVSRFSALPPPTEALTPLTPTTKPRKFARSRFAQFKILTRRHFIRHFRDLGALRVRVGQTIGLTLLLCVMLWRLGNTQADTKSRLMALFFGIFPQFILALLDAISAIPENLPVLLRERADHLYGFFPWFLSLTVADFFIVSFPPTFFSVVSFFAFNMNGGAREFVVWWLSLMVMAHFSSALAHTLVLAARGSVTRALTIMPLVVVVILLTAGLLIPISTLITPIKWISYVNPIKYLFNSVCWSQLEDFEMTCTESELVTTPFGQICPILNGSDLLRYSDIEKSGEFVGIVIVAGAYVLLRVVSPVVLGKKF